MELYRVLLVDDEENIREGISRKMDWQGLGFSLAGEASNGRDAISKCRLWMDWSSAAAWQSFCRFLNM